VINNSVKQGQFNLKLSTCQYKLNPKSRDAYAYVSLYNKVAFAQGNPLAIQALQNYKFPHGAALILGQLQYILSDKSKIKKVNFGGINYIHLTQKQFCLQYLKVYSDVRMLRNYTKYLEERGLIETTCKFNTQRVKGNLPNRRKWYSLGTELIIDGIKISYHDLLAYAKLKPIISETFYKQSANKLYEKGLLKCKRIYKEKLNKLSKKPATLINVDKFVDNNYKNHAENNFYRTNKFSILSKDNNKNPEEKYQEYKKFVNDFTKKVGKDYKLTFKEQLAQQKSVIEAFEALTKREIRELNMTGALDILTRQALRAKNFVLKYGNYGKPEKISEQGNKKTSSLGSNAPLPPEESPTTKEEIKQYTKEDMMNKDWIKEIFGG
jgi:hypothetical protein